MHSYFARKGNYKPLIAETPSAKLGICIVIPSFNEENLEKSLLSILGCTKPKCDVEVMVVVNYPQGADETVFENAKQCLKQIENLSEKHNCQNFKLFAIKAFSLPLKHAGVGLARRIGMDEAAWRMQFSDYQYKIIACFDADATCSENYLTELEKLWVKYPDTEACTIRYEHPTKGKEFTQRVYNGIAQYELHLRYYVIAGKYVGHPFSHHTVGSSMACSRDAYMRYGGMNKLKAGEDFYFLQKIIPHGKFKELNSCCIYPSPRPSYRVPFGTGRAISKYIEENDESYLTYNFDSWLPLKTFFENIVELYSATHKQTESYLSKQHICLQEFLVSNNFKESIDEINANTSNPESFKKRFFQWFDAFKLLKYMNFANESNFARQPILIEAQKLAAKIGIPVGENLLYSFREWELYCNKIE